MAWECYYEYGGNVVINAEATAKYASHLSWFTDGWKATGISDYLGENYTTPLGDNAPWVDSDHPESYSFYGAYPLNVAGVDDSTRQAAITENISHGGNVGLIRHATRSVVFEAILLGENECAVNYGKDWLDAALNGSVCNTGCEGEDLCYFACNPCGRASCALGGEHTCAEPDLRHLRGSKCVSGPTVTRKRNMSGGGTAWIVTFTVVSGNPFEFGADELLIEGFMSGTDPWVPEEVPPDWLYDDTPTTFVEEDCAEPVWSPLVDPLCPAIITPPLPPSINPNCFETLPEWDRRWFTLPSDHVPLWGDVVPTVKVQAGPEEVRPLRLRFYLDPARDGTGHLEPCKYCADIVVSYLPPNYTLTIDGAEEIAYAEGPGGLRRRADHLLFKTDGTPFSWPQLTCGETYVVTVDTAPGATSTPEVDVLLTPKAAS